MERSEYYELATEHVAECNLCGSREDSWATIAIADRFGYPARSQLCMHCGLVFLSPRLPAAAYRKFYADGTYRKLTGTQRLEESQWNYAGIMARVLRSTLNGNGGQHLLDIGGSTGIMADKLRSEFGVIPWVLDPSEDELAKAMERKIATIHGTIETYCPKESGVIWDIVTVFQSIDHFMDIKAALRKIHDCLETRGLLILDICNVLQLLDKARAVEEVCKIDHPFGLTDTTMTAFLELTGFKIEYTGTSVDGRKTLFICRKTDFRSLEGPNPRSVIKFLAVLNRVRLEQFYAALHSQSDRKPGSSAAAGAEFHDHAQGAGSVVDRLPDANYD